MSARKAATILLVRAGDAGPEVFMVQRHRRSGFLPNAWVFPGGRVDARDHRLHPGIVGGEALLPRLALPEDDARAHAVAGVRETFEEAGIWLGSGELPESERGPLQRGERALADLLDETGAVVDLDALHPWAWWVTPEVEPKRYDTRFLLARVDAVHGRHDEHETVDSRWVSPQAVLAEADPAAFPLAPPTWWTLRELAAWDDPEAIVAAAAARVLRPIQPVMEFGDRGIRLLLPGDPGHPEDHQPGVPDRITFEHTWVAWREGERLPDLPDPS